MKSSDWQALKIHIPGQPMGGKNNIGITRAGKRYPKAAWAKWRDATVLLIRAQLRGFKTITEPVNIRFDYIAADHRRRDMPAILDSVFHCLEKAGFCADDTLIWVTQSSRSYSKERAGVTITVVPEPDRVHFT